MANLDKLINLELLTVFKNKIMAKIPTKVSQLTNDLGFKSTDTNTTYTLSKNGLDIVLTGSDGTENTVRDETGSSAVDNLVDEYAALQEDLNNIQLRISNGERNIEAAQSDIRDNQTAISGKANANHSHSASDIKSGTLSNDRLQMDTNPMFGSSNPVTSGAVYTGLSEKQKKISGGTAAPTGGSDGDIYIQY